MFRVNEIVEDDSVRDRKEALPNVGWRDVIIAGVKALEEKAAKEAVAP